MKIALCQERQFTGDLYCMIQYDNGYWMRVSNSSVWESDNKKYVEQYFPEYKDNGILGDRVNSSDSQIQGKDIIKIKEIEGETPIFKLKNFYIDNGGYRWLLCHYIDNLCRMEQIKMKLFPEIVEEMKSLFFTKLEAAKIAGGELIHISNKGMGKVKLPGGSLVRRDGYGGKVLLPDGIIAESESYGSGRNFGYSWNTTNQKMDSNSPDFDWWNWIVLTGKKTFETAVFGCRNGQADEL